VRIALGIEYDGSGFCGWQTQTGGSSVQQALESALTSVAATPIRVQCAGRTDAGVHACGQVAHFDTHVARPDRAWLFGTNANLPRTVSVLWVHPVTTDFHARFSATARGYRYVILNRATRPGLWDKKMGWECRVLDLPVMQTAAEALIGEHDFTSFRAAGCQAHHPVRRITHLEVSQQGDLIFVDIEANAFLHHMVRNIVGVLLEIGRGERSPEWAAEVLAARDRTLAGMTAPASGLYLTRVRYPSRYRLPNLPDAVPFESLVLTSESAPPVPTER
jgi:tRNA pseudouridine38-40 synthase